MDAFSRESVRSLFFLVELPRNKRYAERESGDGPN